MLASAPSAIVPVPASVFATILLPAPPAVTVVSVKLPLAPSSVIDPLFVTAEFTRRPSTSRRLITPVPVTLAVNPEPTPLSGSASAVLRESASEALPTLLQRLPELLGRD